MGISLAMTALMSNCLRESLEIGLTNLNWLELAALAGGIELPCTVAGSGRLLAWRDMAVCREREQSHVT
jgi:hypothetical protein